MPLFRYSGEQDRKRDEVTQCAKTDGATGFIPSFRIAMFGRETNLGGDDALVAPTVFTPVITDSHQRFA